MGKAKLIISFLLIIGMLCSFVGCGNNDDANTSETTTSEYEKIWIETTTKKADTSDVGDYEKYGLSTARGKLDYFLRSFNGVKSDATSVVLEDKTGSRYTDYQGADEGSISETISNSILNSMVGEDNPLWNTYKGKDRINEKFPPAGAVCNLKIENIKDITCEEVEGYYIMNIVLLNEDNPIAGYGVGSIASILTVQSIKNPISGDKVASSLEPDFHYENVSCTAKINKTTGRMEEYYVNMPVVLNMKGVGTSYKVGLRVEETWLIYYE